MPIEKTRIQPYLPMIDVTLELALSHPSICKEWIGAVYIVSNPIPKFTSVIKQVRTGCICEPCKIICVGATYRRCSLLEILIEVYLSKITDVLILQYAQPVIFQHQIRHSIILII